MKNVYFLGTYSDETSLGMYSNNLIKELSKYKEYNFIDKRRKSVSGNIFCKVRPYFNHLLKIYKEIENSDNNILIDVHNFCWIPPVLIGKNRVKRILIVHDFFSYDRDYYDFVKGFSKKILYYYNSIVNRFFFKRTFKKIDVIVAISEATKKEIMDKFGDSLADKIEVIHNGIDNSIFKSLVTTNSKKDKYLLYVGSEIGRKNLKNIISAFSLVHKEFTNLKLFKAPIEKIYKYREKTLEVIRENNLIVGKDIILIDKFLSLEELVELYQNAEIFLFPTLKEGFGFPIIEALACGIPVITTNYEPMIELVPYKEMTVNPKSPKDIADKIIMILRNQKLKQKMVKDGIEYVKRFSRENTGNKFIEIIKKL